MKTVELLPIGGGGGGGFKNDVCSKGDLPYRSIV